MFATNGGEEDDEVIVGGEVVVVVEVEVDTTDVVIGASASDSGEEPSVRLLIEVSVVVGSVVVAAVLVNRFESIAARRVVGGDGQPESPEIREPFGDELADRCEPLGERNEMRELLGDVDLDLGPSENEMRELLGDVDLDLGPSENVMRELLGDDGAGDGVRTSGSSVSGGMTIGGPAGTYRTSIDERTERIFMRFASVGMILPLPPVPPPPPLPPVLLPLPPSAVGLVGSSSVMTFSSERVSSGSPIERDESGRTESLEMERRRSLGFERIFLMRLAAWRSSRRLARESTRAGSGSAIVDSDSVSQSDESGERGETGADIGCIE